MRFYAVRVGKTPGVYTTWNECKEQTNGYPGAIFKAFDSEEEANQFAFPNKDVQSVDAHVYIGGKSYFCAVDRKRSCYSCGVVIDTGEDKILLAQNFFEAPDIPVSSMASFVIGAALGMSFCYGRGISRIMIHTPSPAVSGWCTREWEARSALALGYVILYDMLSARLKVFFANESQIDPLAESLAEKVLQSETSKCLTYADETLNTCIEANFNYICTNSYLDEVFAPDKFAAYVNSSEGKDLKQGVCNNAVQPSAPAEGDYPPWEFPPCATIIQPSPTMQKLIPGYFPPVVETHNSGVPSSIQTPESPQKPVITSFKDIPPFTHRASYAVDVPLNYLKRQLDSMFADGLDLEPEFQRGHVWTEEQQSAYVEFLFRGGLTGRDIYFNNPSIHMTVPDGCYNDFVCVDGLQRLTALTKFLDNKLRVFGSLYTDFTDSIPLSYTVRFHINDLKSYKAVLRWYLEMNTGGTPHTDAEINRVTALYEAAED